MPRIIVKRKVKPLSTAKNHFISVQYRSPDSNEWTHSCYVSEARVSALKGRGYRFVDTRRGVVYE